MNSVAISSAGVPLPGWAPRLASFARKVLARLGRDGEDVSFLLCDDPTIADLNLRFRGKEGATDVLSFPQDEGAAFPSHGGKARRPAGDVVISLDTLWATARDLGVCADEELRRLAIHGILHLGGMDHASNDDTEPMLRLQESILEGLSGLRVLPAGADGKPR